MRGEWCHHYRFLPQPSQFIIHKLSEHSQSVEWWWPWAGRPKFYGSVFILTTTSRRALGPTHLIQWVLVALSAGVKQLEAEAIDRQPISRLGICGVLCSQPLHVIMARWSGTACLLFFAYYNPCRWKTFVIFYESFEQSVGHTPKLLRGDYEATVCPVVSMLRETHNLYHMSLLNCD
jgi:hypothetical protein